MSEAALANKDSASVESKIHCDSFDEAVLCESGLRGFEDSEVGLVLRVLALESKPRQSNPAARFSDSGRPVLGWLSPHLCFLRSKRREP